MIILIYASALFKMLALPLVATWLRSLICNHYLRYSPIHTKKHSVSLDRIMD